MQSEKAGTLLYDILAVPILTKTRFDLFGTSIADAALFLRDDRDGGRERAEVRKLC